MSRMWILTGNAIWTKRKWNSSATRYRCLIRIFDIWFDMISDIQIWTKVYEISVSYQSKNVSIIIRIIYIVITEFGLKTGFSWRVQLFWKSWIWDVHQHRNHQHHSINSISDRNLSKHFICKFSFWQAVPFHFAIKNILNLWKIIQNLLN